MRKIYTTLLTTSLVIFIASSIVTGCHQKKNVNTELEPEDEDMYDGIDQATAFEIEKTKDPATGKVPWQKLRIAIEETEQTKNFVRQAQQRGEAIQALSWIERGPNGDFSRLNGNSRPNDDQTSGRIRAVMIDSLDPTHKTVFAGSVAGGLWKTTDITVSPANWLLVNDFLSNLAIADLTQDPRPGFQNIMYLCTGESYGNGDAVRGVGVFKSVDAGVTWNFLPSTSSFLRGTKIVCDFQGNVYLGTRTTGLLRSTDGGTSWTTITPSGLNSDICDLEISSTGAAGRLHVTTGIGTTAGYRFTDIPSTVTSGAGWNSPTTPFTSFTARIELAVSGNILYSLPVSGSAVPTIWKSIDGGDNWAATVGQPAAGFVNQGWYCVDAAINPANPNECIVGGLDCYKTTDGGASWPKISTWVGNSGQYVHADQHDVQWWDGGSKLLFACDGGIHYSSNGGTTIRDRNKGLRIKQFYSVAIHPTETNYFLAGAQDNGMHRLNHPGLDSSQEVYGGDGCFAAIDQNEGQFQFGSYVYNVFRRSTTNGSSWSTPVSFATDGSNGRFVNPWDYDNNTNKLYACWTTGTYLRWNNPQSGNTTEVVTASGFSGNVSAVHASPYTANRVFFGMGSGGIQFVDNADVGTSVTATSITPAGSSGFVSCVVTGSSDQNLMACYSSYGVNNVWVSTNGGTNWTACDGNLPDMPVRWCLFNPDVDTKAYIATETGVWETDLLNGASTVWVPNTSFPNVRTDMIKYRASDRTIAAGTHGRGIWSATIPPVGGFTFNSPAPATAACPAPASMQVTLTATFSSGFSTPVTLTNSTLPAGTTISYATNPLTTGTTSTTITLNGTNTLAAGSYVITITGTAGSVVQTRDITFTIIPGSGPAISIQPTNQTICAGSNTSFSITSATATGFQWQLSTDGGGSYNNVPVGAPYSGINTSTLSITAATGSLNNYRYRCIASSFCGSTTSNPGILTVNTLPAITTQPADAITCVGSNNTFSVNATGTGVGYQWQLSTNGCAGPWNNIGSANSSSYTLTGITAGQNNTGYRCVVTGVCAPAATSNCGLLTVVTPVSITTQPINQTVCEGSGVSFIVAGSGTGIIYQWQLSTDGGANYNNIGGANAATYTIAATTFAMNNNRYRCQLSNATCTTPAASTAAILTVNTLITITTGPANASICAGSNNTFSVNATGTGISYQWQLSTDGGLNFSNIGSAVASSYTVSAATIGMNGNRYRCVVTGSCVPAATSSAAILTVINPVVITTQPANVQTCSGSSATFTAGGTSVQTVIYQWQISTNDGTTWINVNGANTSSLIVTNTSVSMNGNMYRCLFSSTNCSAPVISNAAILTVRQIPTIGLTASLLTSLLPGQTTTLSATPSPSTGGTITKSWYRDAATFVNSGNIYVVDVTKVGAYQVKIQEAWPSGLTCFSESPVVVISATVSNELFIFPSPNDGRFTVSYYNNGGASTGRTVTVYDSKGGKVYNAKFQVAGSYTLLAIDLQPALTGIYYVVVGDARGKKLAEGKVMVN